MTSSKFLKKTGKIVLYISLNVLVLAGVLALFMTSGAGKRFVKNQVQSFLHHKLKTKVTILAVDYSFPKWVELKGVYIEDLQRDTLLYGEKMLVDFNIYKLISGSVDIRNIKLQNIQAHFGRPSNDSTFNFQFIVDAFSAHRRGQSVEKDNAAMRLTLNRLLLHQVAVTFNDRYGGNFFTSSIGKLELAMNPFQPDNWLFDINTAAGDSLDFSMEMSQAGSKLKKPNATTSATFPIILNLDAGSFKNVNVRIRDAVSGTEYSNQLHTLTAKKFSLDLVKRVANVREVRLDKSTVHFVPAKARVEMDSDTARLVWTVSAGKVAMNDNRFSYEDAGAKRTGGLDYSHLQTSAINLEASDFFYSADSSSASLKQFSFRDNGGFRLDTARANIRITNHSIVATELLIKTPQSILRNNLHVRFPNLATIGTQPDATQVDANVFNSTISIDELFQVAPVMRQYVDAAKFVHTRFTINTKIKGTLKQMDIPYLQFAGLSSTVLNAQATIRNVTNPQEFSYDISLSNSVMPKVDFARFAMAKHQDVIASLPADIHFSGRMQGDLQSVNSIAKINTNQFDFDGTVGITNWRDARKVQYDIRVNNSRIKKALLLSIIDPALIRSNLRLPELIFASGRMSGNMEAVKTDLQTRSSYGTLSTNGYITNFRDPENATYELQLSGNDLAVGALLRKDTFFDKITFNALLRGTGLNYKTMKGTLNGDVANIDYKHHNYTNIGFNASFNQGHIETRGEINDSSLRLAYELTVNANTACSGFSASLKFDTVLLKNLYFLDDTMKLSFSGIFRAENLDPYNLNVYASFDSGRIFYKNRTILLDSISVTARTIDQQTEVSVRSPFLDADATGRFSYTTIVPTIIQYIDHYYNITDSIKRDTAGQEITFNGVVKNHPLFTKLVPGVKWFDDVKFTGGYASKHGDSALNLVINTPAVQYGTKFLRNIGLSLASRNRQLEYNVAFDTLSVGKSTLFKTSLRGTIANDTIAFIAETLDSRNVRRYNVGGTLYSHDNIFSLSLSDSMLMNYEKWNVSAKNNISHSRLGLLVSDFMLNKDSASISAGSQQKIPNSPVDISINNFNIGDITSALNRDTLLAEGMINARISVSDFNKKLPAITGTAELNSFKVNQAIVGKLELSGTRQNENTIRGKISLSENKNDIIVNGHYRLDDDEQQFVANVDLKNLSLSTLQGFSNGYMASASGSILGLLDVKGKFTRPQWKGDVNFDSARFTVARFGTTYLLNKQALVFDYPAICFTNFTVLDTLNHGLIINGDVISQNLSDYNLALDIRSRDFALVNAPKAINNSIYGYAAMDANASLTGTSKAPKLAGEVYFNQHTDLTLVLPEKNIDKDAAGSLVTFIDRDTFSFPKIRHVLPVPAPVVNFKNFVNYNLNLLVDNKASLTIVIDPSSGDELKVRGNAHFNAGVDPGGNLLLTGDYLLDSGYYSLNYQFLSKQFALMKNSKIHFAGAPMESQIDITAEYIANTSPKELLGNEVGSVEAKVAHSFNQKIPLRVILYMKGALKRPVINFDIQLPNDGNISSSMRRTINNKLVQLRDDVAATNKQVFALLALDRFVGEQSTDFFKGTGSEGFNNLARESVSKFLSDALDQIASDLFKGINIDLNLNTYKDFTNADAERPDLSVEVSKNFLNDRLNVTVGKNFGIEGQDGSAKAAQQKGSRFLPDVTVTRKLSHDGKYKMRAYNKNQFEVILDGYIIETGLGFIITMDYDKFQELFARKKQGEK